MSLNKISLSLFSTACLIASLSACGGSDASPLKASDIRVGVTCGDWSRRDSGGAKAECDIEILNTSAASGSVMISWLWKDGGKSCGGGYSNGPDGQPIPVEITPNANGKFHTPQTMMCWPSTPTSPEATNIEVRVRD